MTGLPDYNYPAFNAEAARLRALGYTVENPAENPAPARDQWELYMRTALRQMLTCDVVAFLPGWQVSRGANVEIELAGHLGMEVIAASDIGRHIIQANGADQGEVGTCPQERL